MNGKDSSFIQFIEEVMRRRKRKPSQLATDLGISHATVSRWLAGDDVPGIESCQKIADYSGIPIESVFSIVGHITRISEKKPEWPEFREYAKKMYPEELDEDLITMVEDLIERRRAKKYQTKQGELGK
jgi:transcriptional regulator with XRE-family HTH domain